MSEFKKYLDKLSVITDTLKSNKTVAFLKFCIAVVGAAQAFEELSKTYRNKDRDKKIGFRR